MVFLSIPLVVITLKVVDVLGKKFGYNILKTKPEKSFYPLTTRSPSPDNFIIPRQAFSEQAASC